MFELIHALITSLLLSTAAGFGVDTASSTDDEPANSETGIEVGQLPKQLAVPRDTSSNKRADQDDHQPTALLEQVAFCEPAVFSECSLGLATRLHLTVCFTTAGRSP